MTIELKVFNNYAEMEYTDTIEQRLFLDSYLTTSETVKRMSRGKGKKSFVTKTIEHRLYKKISNKILFPRGFIDFFVPIEEISIEDFSSKSIKFPKLSSDDIRTILQPESGFDLREDQIMAVKKALHFGRGIIQMPPGAGKTEVQSAILKALFAENSDLNVIVIEPTTELGESTVRRFNNYNLDATFYSNTRTTESKIVVAHVSALLNDLEKDASLLEKFKVVIWDEVHHSQCSTWLQLNLALKNAEVSLGFSALAIDEDKIYIEKFNFLTYPEKLVSGSAGRVLLHLSSSYYIDKGFLATPVVFQFGNSISTNLEKEKVWTTLFSEGINSLDRNFLVAQAINLFYVHGRKIIVLVGTKEQAFDITEILIDNFNVNLSISFGGQESYFVNEGRIEKYKGSVLSYFNSGDYKVLLATTHLDEGVDVNNLDTCILASGGKKDRRLIQRIGRVLRKTKTGNFAYIVDFADKNNKILNRHALHRLTLYKDIIGISKDKTFKDCDIDTLDKKFKLLEEI